jgi:hypothetical protein
MMKSANPRSFPNRLKRKWLSAVCVVVSCVGGLLFVQAMTPPHQALAAEPIWAAPPVTTMATASPNAFEEDHSTFLPMILAGPAPLCRFGVNGTPDDTVTDASLGQLRVGWYQRYTTVLTPSPPSGAEFVQTIRLSQTGANTYRTSPSAAQIRLVAAANPGSMWLIGNEPDRRYYQDDLVPHVYAAAYHDLYALLKSADPTARILAGSIVQATEVRLRYLDMVLAAYQQAYGEPMPVDAWSIHGFVLNEVSCEKNPDPEHLGCSGAEIPPGIDDAVGLVLDPADTPPHDWIERNDDFDIFSANIVRFRQWMAQKGYRHTPLLLTEYGVLIPGIFPTFTTARVNAFMNRTFDYLLVARDASIGLPADDYRLVQRLSWFSTTEQDYNGFLFWPNSQLTEMGLNYKAYTAAVNQEVDFTAVSLHATPPTLPANPVTVTLTATVGNAGNLATHSPAVVRFYNGDPAAGGQQIGAEVPISLNGCGATATTTVQWLNATPGDYTLYAVVISAVFESNTANNTTSQRLMRVAEQVMSPIVER